jgi:C-terminal processing protease CtpA/Prc
LLSTVINTLYFTGEKGSVLCLGVKRGDVVKTVNLQRDTYAFQFMGAGDKRVESGIIDENIGYINMSLASNSEKLEADLVAMNSTLGLIVDLRSSYPTWDFTKFIELLFTHRMAIRYDEVPVVSAGMQNKKQLVKSETIINPDGSWVYNKPIVVLVDKSMASRPEDIAIALSALPNATFVGEQTQGVDGEVAKIYLPGGGETSFTGQVIRFANGNEFQGNGIIPHVEVKRTVKEASRGVDEILEKAINVLKENSIKQL